eukprot:5817573-Pleurochrysis_carterae.AAC.1
MPCRAVPYRRNVRLPRREREGRTLELPAPASALGADGRAAAERACTVPWLLHARLRLGRRLEDGRRHRPAAADETRAGPDETRVEPDQNRSRGAEPP